MSDSHSIERTRVRNRALEPLIAELLDRDGLWGAARIANVLQRRGMAVGIGEVAETLASRRDWEQDLPTRRDYTAPERNVRRRVLTLALRLERFAVTGLLVGIAVAWFALHR